MDPNDIADFIEDFQVSVAMAIVKMAKPWHVPPTVLSLALKVRSWLVILIKVVCVCVCVCLTDSFILFFSVH